MLHRANTRRAAPSDGVTRNHVGRKRRLTRASAAGAGIALVAAASAAAFQALPPGGQVNDDPAAGISKTFSVSGGDPTNADVVGGALTAGKPAVPWAIFPSRGPRRAALDQIFLRSFAGGAWTTRGIGTVGGRSSAAPVQRLAELRPEAGRRGARDRLRRCRSDGAVGDVV